MKILFFIDGLSSGGKERRLTELMKSLKSEPSVEFELVVMSKEIFYKEIFSLGIKVHYLIRNAKKDLSIFYKFYKICKSYRPDIVHCWNNMNVWYAIPACKMLHIKLINGQIVDTPVKRNLFNRSLLKARLTFPFSDIIVGNSKAGLAAYNAPLNKSVCIYNGIDSKRFRNLREPQAVRKEIFGQALDEQIIIGMVAAFEKRKDYETLILAGKDLISQGYPIKLIFVGGGSDFEKIKNSVPPLLQPRIIFMGKRTDVESIINIFDIGVLLTNPRVHGEGISNSILEYMAAGKPVIATRGGGTGEIIIDGESGYIIEPNNKTLLVEKIKTILTNRNLIEVLGKNGRGIIGKKFDLNIMTENYVLTYKNLINDEVSSIGSN